MEDFNSEISCSSCSIPSEPPDIRNWFSSYKYESFVLDTCANFGGIFSEEREMDKDGFAIGEIRREKEENFDGFEEIRKVDEHGNLISMEVQDSLSSPSILSEPPDVRNWFSSYVYESPLLDTSDGFKSYASKESECEKDGIVVGESIKDEVANLGQFQETKNSCKQDASDKTCSTKLFKWSSYLVDRKNESHPLFSEPPDIGNWFPDYAYESPILDTNDEFKDTLSIERETSEDEFAVELEDSKREKQEDFKKTTKTRFRNEVAVGKMCSNESGKCNIPLRHDKQENKSICKDFHHAGGRADLTLQGDLRFDKILEASLEVKEVRISSSSNSKEGVEHSGLNGGDSISKLERADSLSITRNPGKNYRKSSNKLIDRRVSIEKSSETKVQTDKVDLASHDQSLYIGQDSGYYLRKPAHGSNDKENEGKEITENGFITTRKNKFIRTNDENSVRVPGGILLQCSRNKGSNNTIGGEKDSVVKRKVLSETTNVQHYEAKAMGITGKWRCPQKSKLPRGPPLKQLRLEQWIHRV